MFVILRYSEGPLVPFSTAFDLVRLCVGNKGVNMSALPAHSFTTHKYWVKR